MGLVDRTVHLPRWPVHLIWGNQLHFPSQQIVVYKTIKPKHFDGSIGSEGEGQMHVDVYNQFSVKSSAIPPHASSAFVIVHFVLHGPAPAYHSSHILLNAHLHLELEDVHSQQGN